MKQISILSMCIAWNVFVIGGGAYLVQVHNWSPGTLFVSFILTVWPGSSDDENDEEVVNEKAE